MKKLKEIIPAGAVFAAGLLSVVLSSEPLVFGQLMFLAFFQNVAFLLVSRARNRNSNNYHLIAAMLSNGVWFMTYAYMVPRGMPWQMLVPFLSGTTLGSLFGAGVSQKIERWLGLSADAAQPSVSFPLGGPAPDSPNLIGEWLKNYALVFCLGLSGILCAIAAGNPWFIAAMIFFAFLQNFGAAVSSRARSRNNFNYSVAATLASGFLFLLAFRYLVVHNMPFSLFIPYAVGTVLGSIAGAKISAVFEKIFNIRPDSHLEGNKPGAPLAGNAFFKIVVLAGSGLIFLQVAGFGSLLGLPNEKSLAILLMGTLAYALQNLTFSIASRAGNRNHLNYHLSSRVLNGVVTYLCFMYAVTNEMSFELFAPIMLGQTIGSVTGQNIGMKIEKKIGAYMDAKK